MIKCFECGSNESIHNHHVVPRILGGTKTIPLCETCHGKVHDRKFLNHKTLQRKGIEKARELGVYKGRRKYSGESKEMFLEKHKESVVLMKEGVKHIEISKIVGVHMNTLTKIKKLLKP